MPKRTDINSILIIGAGPIVIGQACEFDYSGVQACKALKRRGLPDRAGQFEPGDDHDRPGAGRRDLYRADHAGDRRAASSPASGTRSARCCRRWAARPRSTPRWRCRARARSQRYGVELIGANEEAIAKAEDRQLFRQAMDRIGLESPKSRLVDSLDEAREALDACRAAGDHAAVLHAGRHRRRHRLQHRGIRGASSAAGCAPRRRTRCWSRNRCSAGRNTSSKSSATAPTTASSSARSRTSIRWGCIPAIR